MLITLWVILTIGFTSVSLLGYRVSEESVRDSIVERNLPLTANYISSELQKELARPIYVSKTMAYDTFVREWILAGEQDASRMARYLTEVRKQNRAFSSFFVSEKTSNYYTGDGILKKVSPTESRDEWYYRVRRIPYDYEINIDPDLANADKLTIFVNYRVVDENGNYIGAIGLGLAVDSVQRLIDNYERKFHGNIFFVNQEGNVVELGKPAGGSTVLSQVPGVSRFSEQILKEKRGTYRYELKGSSHVLNVHYLPEIKWIMCVEQDETAELSGSLHTLYLNLALSFGVSLVILLLVNFTLSRYQNRIEEMAAVDKLTGLLNRHAFNILISKLLASSRREKKNTSFLLLDVDHFKSVNDNHGHPAGDAILVGVASKLSAAIRTSDLAVRWGGEEFLIVLAACDIKEAAHIAEKLRNIIASSQFEIPGDILNITVSIGVCQLGEEEALHAVNRADEALYRAKREGRNRVEVSQ